MLSVFCRRLDWFKHGYVLICILYFISYRLILFYIYHFLHFFYLCFYYYDYYCHLLLTTLKNCRWRWLKNKILYFFTHMQAMLTKLKLKVSLELRGPWNYNFKFILILEIITPDFVEKCLYFTDIDIIKRKLGEMYKIIYSSARNYR